MTQLNSSEITKMAFTNWQRPIKNNHCATFKSFKQFEQLNHLYRK